MLHGPASDVGRDAAAAIKTRLGVWMFACYSLFYASFVFLNLYRPQSMELIVLGGMNLATVFGFTLIVVALILALIYDSVCRGQEKALAAAEADEGKGRA